MVSNFLYGVYHTLCHESIVSKGFRGKWLLLAFNSKGFSQAIKIQQITLLLTKKVKLLQKLLNLAMNSALKGTFERYIKNLKGFQFEDFIKELFLIEHGTSGFIPTRPVKDNGCDGIIVSTKTIIACYAPDSYDEKAYSKKVKEDFTSYNKSWQKQYPNWQFIFNGALAPKAITAVSTLNAKLVPWGIDQILSIIDNNLNSSQRRKVAELLNIPSSIISQDYLAEILENLLANTTTDPDQLYQFNSNNLIDLEDKIKLNYGESDVAIAMDEFSDMLPNILETGKLFKLFEDEEQDKIKNRIRNDYKNANGTFKERLSIITENYLLQYSNQSDSDYRYNITSVLLYLFEQCLIGIKSES